MSAEDFVKYFNYAPFKQMLDKGINMLKDKTNKVFNFLEKGFNNLDKLAARHKDPEAEMPKNPDNNDYWKPKFETLCDLLKGMKIEIPTKSLKQFYNQFLYGREEGYLDGTLFYGKLTVKSIQRINYLSMGLVNATDELSRSLVGAALAKVFVSETAMQEYMMHGTFSRLNRTIGELAKSNYLPLKLKMHQNNIINALGSLESIKSRINMVLSRINQDPEKIIFKREDWVFARYLEIVIDRITRSVREKKVDYLYGHQLEHIFKRERDILLRIYENTINMLSDVVVRFGAELDIQITNIAMSAKNIGDYLKTNVYNPGSDAPKSGPIAALLGAGDPATVCEYKREGFEYNKIRQTMIEGQLTRLEQIINGEVKGFYGMEKRKQEAQNRTDMLRNIEGIPSEQRKDLDAVLDHEQDLMDGKWDEYVKKKDLKKAYKRAEAQIHIDRLELLVAGKETWENCGKEFRVWTYEDRIEKVNTLMKQISKYEISNEQEAKINGYLLDLSTKMRSKELRKRQKTENIRFYEDLTFSEYCKRMDNLDSWKPLTFQSYKDGSYKSEKYQHNARNHYADELLRNAA